MRVKTSFSSLTRTDQALKRSLEGMSAHFMSLHQSGWYRECRVNPRSSLCIFTMHGDERFCFDRRGILHNHEPEGYHCPFCSIIRGDFAGLWTQASDVVYQDDYTTAFISARWWVNNVGHVIVIPNQHTENLYDLSGEQAAQIHVTAQKIAIAFKEVYACGGTSTRQHNEPDGYQEIWHYHLHVFPRYAGDHLYGSAYSMSTVEDRNSYADRLRQYFLANKEG